MTATIIRKWVFCNRESCDVRFDDGTSQTLDGDIGQYTDEQWIQLAIAWYTALIANGAPDPVRTILMSCSDGELVDECIRRHLNVVAAVGEV
jgi:hypothetical protein